MTVIIIKPEVANKKDMAQIINQIADQLDNDCHAGEVFSLNQESHWWNLQEEDRLLKDIILNLSELETVSFNDMAKITQSIKEVVNK